MWSIAGQIWFRLGSVGSGLVSAELGPLLAEVGHQWSNLAGVSATLAEVGPHFVDSGPTCPTLGDCAPNLVDFGPNSAKFGGSVPIFTEVFPDSETSPDLDHFSPRLEQASGAGHLYVDGSDKGEKFPKVHPRSKVNFRFDYSEGRLEAWLDDQDRIA